MSKIEEIISHIFSKIIAYDSSNYVYLGYNLLMILDW
ncbi:uncharacterized protein METZ01_LOCUS231703 [marine metagenome]|uniref:Uncharacterized protein n=1 Tax=marine metagenome TaxID=408172 RepID=A0A382GV63_9ZZZZ